MKYDKVKWILSYAFLFETFARNQPFTLREKYPNREKNPDLVRIQETMDQKNSVFVLIKL